MDPGSLLRQGLGALERGGRRGVAALRGTWRRIRAWRRIRFTSSGGLFTAATFAVGFAAVNTGNNLLYLLLGAMLGLIAVSGWLSERVIRKLEVHRRVPRGVTAGRPCRIRYLVRNPRRRIPSFALELGEEGLPGRAYVQILPAGASVVVSSETRFHRRGIVRLSAVTLSTSFPFGFFLKERDVAQPGEVVVWPRTDRPVREPHLPAGLRMQVRASAAAATAATRGEYRALRSYRVGDDPRDIHWRTSARLARPVVREYDSGGTESLWICLDTRSGPGDDAEAAVEIAASLAARVLRSGRRVGFAAPGLLVEEGEGPMHLEALLTALARVDFHPGAPPPRPPVGPDRCVLVAPGPCEASGFGDLFFPGRER